jgi:starch synthase
VVCAGALDTEAIGKEIAENVRQSRSEARNEIVWIDQWVRRADLVCLFSQATLFVCPSVYEPFGIINLEAMSCGTPVVASSVGGIPEVVVHGQTGWLVPFEPIDAQHLEPRDPQRFSQDLATAINHLFHSKEALDAMGLEARRRVVNHFSWESVARQTLEFYKEVFECHQANVQSPIQAR